MNGLEVITPSSISYSGTSASINADGSVTYSSCSSISLNGVFSATYENYLTVATYKGLNGTVRFRYRASGSDYTSTDYYAQMMAGQATSAYGQLNSAQTTANLTNLDTTYQSGHRMYLFGPYLAQRGTFRIMGQSGRSGGEFVDHTANCLTTTQFDGFTMFPSSSSFTGLVTVFGFNQ